MIKSMNHFKKPVLWMVLMALGLTFGTINAVAAKSPGAEQDLSSLTQEVYRELLENHDPAERKALLEAALLEPKELLRHLSQDQVRRLRAIADQARRGQKTQKR